MTKEIRTYSAAFRAEAVKKIADDSGIVSALSIAMQTLSE